MATNLDRYWNEIIAQCKLRIDRNATAGIKSVVVAMKLPPLSIIPHSLEPTDEDVQTIAGMITQDGEYQRHDTLNDTFISYNHLFKINESIKEVNESTILLNRRLNIQNLASIAIAAITGFFVAKETFNDDSYNLAQIRKLLEEQKIQSQEKGRSQIMISIGDSVSLKQH